MTIRTLMSNNVMLRTAAVAAAAQVIFEGRKAVGVELVHDGKTHVINARKEIIVSAGTVGSAKLLLLSGVGPRNHLREMKVGIVSL